MLTNNTSLPHGCVCVCEPNTTRSFMVKLAKGIAVESGDKLSHNLPSSTFLNVDVPASGIKQSLILQLNKLNAVKFVLW